MRGTGHDKRIIGKILGINISGVMRLQKWLPVLVHQVVVLQWCKNHRAQCQWHNNASINAYSSRDTHAHVALRKIRVKC